MTGKRRVLSLPVRLAATYALLVGAALLVVAGLVIQLVRSHLESGLDDRLSAAVTSFADGPARGVEDADGLQREARRWLALHGFAADEAAAIRIEGAGILTAGGLDLDEVEGSSVLFGETASRWFDLEGPGGGVRGLTVPLLLDGRRAGTLVVAASRASVDETIGALASGVAWASVVALALSTAFGLVAVRRTLRPLSRVAAGAEAVQETGDLSRRVSGDGPRDEVGRLAEAFDGMLERLEEAFGSQRRFLADASHELRTPLTIARGQLELLQAEIAGASARSSVADAMGELDRMGRIVEDLLLLARLDEGLPLERKPVEVELVMQEALLRGLASAERPARVEVPPGLAALADPERLLQVLTNLVSNSVRHAGEEASIALRGRREGPRVVLEVADTGPGIPPEQLPHVFERFYRGEAARRRPGTGLGLSITASLIEAMGGTISARSERGAGTTFRIDLQAAEPGRGNGPPSMLDSRSWMDARHDEPTRKPLPS